MKKIAAILSLCLSIHLSYAKDGFLIGLHSSYAILKANKDAYKGYRYGFLIGYKQFFNDELGIRYYADLYNRSRHTSGQKGIKGVQIYTSNFNINTDVLYKFLQKNDFEFLGFTGLVFGYSTHVLENKNSSNESVSGFDLGLNLGLQIAYINHHIELFSKIALLEQKDKIKQNEDFKIRQNQIGLRYIYSF